MKKILILGLVLIAAVGAWWAIQHSGSTGQLAQATKGVIAKISAPVRTEPFATELVTFVPRDALTVQRCNYSSPQFKRYSESPLAQLVLSFLQDPAKLRTTVESFTGGKTLEDLNIPQLATVLEKMKQLSEAVKTTEGFQDPYYADDALIFQRPTNASKPMAIGAVFYANRKVDVPGLVAKFRTLGAEIVETNEAGLTLYSYDLVKAFASLALPEGTLPSQGMPLAMLYFGISGNRIGFGSDKDDILPFLTNKPFPSPPDLLVTDYSKAAIARANYNPKEDFCFQYGDYRLVIRNMIEQITALEKLGQPQDEKTQRGLAIMRNFPVLGYTSSVRYDDGFDMSGSLGLEPKNEHVDLTPWLPYFDTPKAAETTELLPGTSFLAFGVNTSGMTKGIREALKHLPATPPEAEAAIALAESVTSLSYAINYVAGEALFPDLTIVIASTNPSEVVNQLRTIPSKIPQAGAFGNWIEKKVEGTPVIFIASPFGVGAFVATINDKVVVASSEIAIRRAILIGNKKEKSLSEVLAGQDLPRGSNSLVVYYLDLPRVLETMNGLKGALGSMVPAEQQAQFNFPPILSELLDAVGAISFEFSLKDNYIDFRAKQKVRHRGAAV